MNDHEPHFFCCCSVAVNSKVKFLQKYKFLITEKYLFSARKVTLPFLISMYHVKLTANFRQGEGQHLHRIKLRKHGFIL